MADKDIRKEATELIKKAQKERSSDGDIYLKTLKDHYDKTHWLIFTCLIALATFMVEGYIVTDAKIEGHSPVMTTRFSFV